MNKYVLKISPLRPEFRRGMLHAVNPVGSVALVAASGLSTAMYFHALGDTLQPYSPVAAVIAFVLTPLMAIAIKGRYYLRRTDDGSGEPLHCGSAGRRRSCGRGRVRDGDTFRFGRLPRFRGTRSRHQVAGRYRRGGGPGEGA